MVDVMSFHEFISELQGSRVEGELVKTIFYSLLTSIILLGILYVVKLQTIPNFMTTYGYFLFFAMLSYAFLLPVVRQVRAYKDFLCMSGMMIGMTAGMMAGFLSGYLTGATNGMFMGSMFGILIGISLGIWLGSCCGVMGVIEGIMAGLMGGLMGGMTAVMLLNDHLRIATIPIFLVCTVILFMLNYMIFKEMKESERQVQEDHMITIMLTLILTFLTLVIMIYGPRSGLFA